MARLAATFFLTICCSTIMHEHELQVTLQ